jgi:hypothetical protein
LLRDDQDGLHLIVDRLFVEPERPRRLLAQLGRHPFPQTCGCERCLCHFLYSRSDRRLQADPFPPPLAAIKPRAKADPP